MSEHQMILKDSFWKFLVSLEELSERKEKTKFCASIEIDVEALEEFKIYLSRYEINFEMDDCFIYPIKDKSKIKIEFSLSEWLALQATFQEVAAEPKSLKHYFQRIVRNKMTLLQNAHEQFNLFRKPVNVAINFQEFENLKKKIDHVVCYQKPINLHFFNSKACQVFPHRLVYLDGILCVVGESLKDKTLVYFGLEDIKNVEVIELAYEANLSQIEINEFISHLRLINGKEERLVLKIYSQYETDLLPSHHYLGNPFVTSNVDGDMIWAATLEMCEDIYQWLYLMKDRVEVLDPGHVAREFAQYCELKKENSGLKKAS